MTTMEVPAAVVTVSTCEQIVRVVIKDSYYSISVYKFLLAIVNNNNNKK